MQKKQAKKPFYRLAILLLAALCFLFSAWGAIERHFYPTDYSDAVEAYSALYEIDEYLIYAIIRTESGFDAEAVSNVGARGLMQITEDTFIWLKAKLAPDENITYDDLFTPEVNIRFGVYYISLCLQRYGNVATAAAAYHSGWGTVDTLLQSPKYTTDGQTLTAFPYRQMGRYVTKVEGAYKRYLKLYT